MIDLEARLNNVAAHPVREHAFMVVAGAVRAIDIGDARGPAYAFEDDAGCEGILAPGVLDHSPNDGECLRLTGGWACSCQGLDMVSDVFLGIAAETVH